MPAFHIVLGVVTIVMFALICRMTERVDAIHKHFGLDKENEDDSCVQELEGK